MQPAKQHHGPLTSTESPQLVKLMVKVDRGLMKFMSSTVGYRIRYSYVHTLNFPTLEKDGNHVAEINKMSSILHVEYFLSFYRNSFLHTLLERREVI